MIWDTLISDIGCAKISDTGYRLGEVDRTDISDIGWSKSIGHPENIGHAIPNVDQ